MWRSDIFRGTVEKDNSDQKNGTIISIYFSNAFSDTSLNCFNFVLQKLNKKYYRMVLDD